MDCSPERSTAVPRTPADRSEESCPGDPGDSCRTKWVPGAATISCGEIEHPVWAELQLAAVVARLAGMRNRENGTNRGRIPCVGIRRVQMKLVDLDRSVLTAGVVGVKDAACGVMRRKRH